MSDLPPAQQRRIAALRACERILSEGRPVTMRERLAALSTADGLDAPPDFYGGNGPVRQLEERVAGLLGTENCVFFPTGTMAQQVALRYGAQLTGRDAVALHPLSHLERHERYAYSQLTGLRAIWPGSAARQPSAAELAELGEPFGTLTVELPLRDAGFVLPSWDELVELSAAARAAGARVHFDGARIWDTTVHFDRPLDEIAGLADSTYVSFYKTLGGISGAALAGTNELAAYARTWRHRYGGNLYQQWPAALSALIGLDTELPRVPGYVRHARVVAGALAALPGARVNPLPPHTHRFQLWLPHPAEALNHAALTLAEEQRVWFVDRWQNTAAPNQSMTEVTVAGAALDWTAPEVTDAAEHFLYLARRAE
ncbi:threonine aldolase [Kitasatospora sp. MAA4]|uniref:threonine aldolase family protein n=1 Tax=Kitasatospora sp. MAA4 TaxID=3035093 RepID=UPI0024740698|nr:beta-eliminating lyase-related protein [Kitasatospora sp. MAA4]MDH6131874.1 threonine aldolase [Kitasatospora sp. MAA4]